MITGHRSDRIYLGHRGSEDDHFVQLPHALHELIHARSFDDVDIVILTLNLHGNGEVGLMKNLRRWGQPVFGGGVSVSGLFGHTTYLETAMNQGLVQVEDQTFPIVEAKLSGRQ